MLPIDKAPNNAGYDFECLHHIMKQHCTCIQRYFATLVLRFMQNLQTEVQEMEFIQFSRGLNIMTKEDFIEWLLYFTNEENNEAYWQNVKQRIRAGEVGTVYAFMRMTVLKYVIQTLYAYVSAKPGI